MARLDKWEKEHVKHVAKYEAEIRRIYEQAMAEAARIMSTVTFDASRPLSFSDYPLIQKLISKLGQKMAASVETVITKGIDAEWDLSDEKMRELAEKLFGDLDSELMELRKQAYLERRDKAREAFKTRKERGLSLSDRVWQYTGQFKEELEMALDLGLREGKSADELSREVRKYLNNPSMLFRRVRDEHGVLHLSKRAKAYHPGQGVYRSSYKNARRLTATETNMAYRSADHEYRQTADFIVGIKIQLSNNHTLNGEPFVDICDHLMGDYPKDFKFVGWHPLCRCFVTNILKTPEERREDIARRLRGEAPIPPEQSKNYVGDTPDQFKAWCALNAGRVERAKSLPYFIRDNKGYYDAALNPKKAEELTPLEIAKYRHEQRTPEQIETIKNRWHARQERYRRIEMAANNVLNVAKDYGEVDYAMLQALIDKHDLKALPAATRSVAGEVLKMKQAETTLVEFIPNAHALHHTHALSDLQETYWELDEVMKNWLRKYNYPSLDEASLDHLKNKLEWELTRSIGNYSHKDIATSALTEKINLVKQQIAWEALVAQATSLMSFKTSSSAYKASLVAINDAIRKKDYNALQQSTAEASRMQQKLATRRARRGGDIKSALNKEYKGGVIGTDITASVDTKTMISADPFRGTFTNNVARMQGFDAPAKLVTDAEFDALQKECGDIFYRTVNAAEFHGVKMTSKEFAEQLYKADLFELNGPGGRVYGDGLYVASSAWDGNSTQAITNRSKTYAYDSSICYGHKHDRTIYEMTWCRRPNIIKQADLLTKWNSLSPKQQSKFGKHINTYGCALGYDGMLCEGVNYIVIWNRSIIAVRR